LKIPAYIGIVEFSNPIANFGVKKWPFKNYI
jgi:hypothetical protein